MAHEMIPNVKIGTMLALSGIYPNTCHPDDVFGAYLFRRRALLFSDVMMPGALDGVDLSYQIRKRHPQLPVLLTTGHVEPAQEKAEAMGVRVLPKPYRIKDLKAALEAARLSVPG